MTDLNLQVGKKYKTRDGHTIEITNDDKHYCYPFDFVTVDKTEEYSGSLTVEGKFFEDEEPHGYDIVAEVTDPKEETQETNLREETRAISKLLYQHLSDVEYKYAIDPCDENKECLELAQKAVGEYLRLVTKDA